MTDIINGPIYEGCYVRLRNGVVCGAIKKFGYGWKIDDILTWHASGLNGGRDNKERDVIEVLPDLPPAPVSPSPDQELWDKVAVKAMGLLMERATGSPYDMAMFSADKADAFMAERAKRRK